MSVLSLDRLL
nr:unnamed protein product [Callosobruchus chinensis]CAH7734216.1 unnamed protein product [Callosobruchus chinensis]CAH7744534.1 unnamed protein product [Callosobruchus chinensis]CAH7747917.1 unnamed protein product [Callosobruchus chinensis]CAH7752557.1 unnamed protein product [Callosobruchus chinensis]